MSKYPEFTVRNFDRILRLNNFTIDRNSGDHRIYTNGIATIAIPVGHKSINRMLTRRLIKENNLVLCK